MYRVFIGKFGFYLPTIYQNQEEAEKAGVSTNFGFTVENQHGDVVAVKGRTTEILRIPEKNDKKEKRTG
jgi:hypothetical protein